MNNSRIRGYIRQLQQGYYGGNWLDEDFEKKLKLVNEENAFIKPDGHIHSIAEVTSHILEWRKELIERLSSGRGAVLQMESANNWYSNDFLKLNGWAMLKAGLDASQQELILLLENKDDTFLENKCSDDMSYEWLLAGLIEHDIYHLGQIGLIYKQVTYQTSST